MADLETLPGTNLLNLNWEVPYTQADYMGNLLQSWFVAPATARYRFYMSCDATCEFWMSETADDQAAKTKLLDKTSKADHRQYWLEVNG